MSTSRTSRTLRLIASVAATALVVAACGGSDEPAAPAPAAPAPAAPAAPVEVDPRADWPEKLRFAAVPSEEAENLDQTFRFIVEILELETGLEVELFRAADYAGVIEALIAGRVDIASFGPFSYVLATALGADAQAIGVLVTGEDAQPGYTASLLALADNGDINTIADVDGKNVCFVDPASTSGYLVPFATHLDAGQDPKEAFNVVLAGGHDTSLLGVVDGTCDAGWAFTGMADRLAAGGVPEGTFKTVIESSLIAGPPTAMWLGLPDSLQEVIRTTFAERMTQKYAVEAGLCASAEDCAFFGDFWGFLPGDDSFYDGIRNLCRQLGDEVRACEGVA